MTHRRLPSCPGCVPFPTFGKKKGYVDEYGHKTLNFTKIAAFVCQNALTFPTLGKKKEYIYNEYGHKIFNFTKIAAFICVLECINMDDTNQSQLNSFHKRMKSRQILYHRGEKESLTVEQT